jgi:ribosomal-protein-alanine N-acetyltransferase
MNAEKSALFRMFPLAPEYIPFLEVLEEASGLPFWGVDNYRRFFEEFSEYFGFCLIPKTGEKRLAGFSLARAAFEDMELLKIGVAPEFQRFGFGTRLLEETLAEGEKRGSTRCFLEVRKSNQKAIQFYSAHSFRIAGARLNYYSNPVEDAWIMERRIHRT